MSHLVSPKFRMECEHQNEHSNATAFISLATLGNITVDRFCFNLSAFSFKENSAHWVVIFEEPQGRGVTRCQLCCIVKG